MHGATVKKKCHHICTIGNGVYLERLMK